MSLLRASLGLVFLSCAEDVIAHRRLAAEATPTRFVATGGADSTDCLREAPCLSLRRAFEVAQDGEVVEVAAGTYRDQQLTGASKGPRPVLFRPATGASVTLGDVRVTASDLELRGFVVGWVELEHPAARITAQGLNAGGFTIAGASEVRWLGGTVVGPVSGGRPTVIGVVDGASEVTPSDITIEGVWFRDWSDPNPAVSGRCLQLASGRRVAVRRNRFQRCGQSAMYLFHFGPGADPSEITIENNFIGAQDLFSISTRAWPGLVIRHNSMLQPLDLSQADGPGSAIRIVANVGPGNAPSCGTASWYEHNVWARGGCGSTDVTAPSDFVDPGSLDLHLKPGAAAIDRAPVDGAPPDDIDAEARPRGAAPDCGADER